MTRRVPLGRLAARLLWPERRRVAFLALCIALGTGALFAVTNAVATLEGALYVQARDLLGADLTLTSSRPLPDATLAALDAATRGGPPFAAARTVELASMARLGPDGPAFLTALKGVDGAYPLRGGLRTDPPDAADRFRAGEGALVAASIATQRGARPGDTLTVGTTSVPVVGTLLHEPGAGLAGALAFAPRVLVPKRVIDDADLVRFGSRVRYAHLLALDGDVPDPRAAVAALANRLRADVESQHVRITSYADSQPPMQQALDRVAMFFAMVALVALALALVAVVSGVLSLLDDQLDAVATLRSMGVGPGDIRRVYTLLCLVLGLGGGALGLALGLGLDALVLDLAGAAAGLDLSLQVDAAAALECLLVATVVAVAFNYATVRTLASVPPVAVLSDRGAALRLRRPAAALLVVLGLAGAFGWLYARTLSLPSATLFTGGLAAAALVTWLLVLGGFASLRALHAALTRLGRGSLALRHGLLRVLRHRRRSMVYLLTLGLGLALVVALHAVQASLQVGLHIADGDKAPNLFLVDLQADQVATVEQLAATHGEAPTLRPLVRARLTHIDGVAPRAEDDGEARSPEEARRAWALTREYNLTWADAPNPSETLVAGRFWAPGEGRAEVSLEERFARRLGVDLGARLRFDVQGRPLEVTVTSIRRIQWLSLLPNFFVVLPPQVLGGAPHTLIGSLRVPRPESVAAFQSELFAAHPNVSVIDLAPIFAQARTLFGHLGLMLRALALVCVIVGLAVLFAALRMGQAERRREADTWRTLGTPAAALARLASVEHLAVGAVAAVTVLAVGLGLAAGVTSQLRIDLVLGAETLLGGGLVPLLLPLVSARLLGGGAGRRT